MRAACLALSLCASCAFTPPEGGGPEPGPGGDDDSGSGDELPAICDPEDADLRLCLDFDAPLVDRSVYGGPLAASAVDAMERDGQAAAGFTPASTIHVREANVLNIEDVITIELWIRPSVAPGPTPTRFILDNNQQYSMSFTADRRIRCQIGSTNQTSEPLPDDREFHHVACAYDRTQLKVYVDGSVSDCLDTTAAIPTLGDDGLAIGANLSGSNDVPRFDEPYVGELDNVRVWRRADLDLCAAANRSGCKRTCD